MKIESATETRSVAPRGAVAEPRHTAPAQTRADAAPEVAAPVPTAPQLEHAIAEANRSMRAIPTNLEFEQDQDSGKVVVRVIDSETRKVIRQMPTEDMLAMSKALDRLQGLMVHLRV